ncbi:KOW motif-containing protein [Candidatus Latescibacterota bacterium]
MRKIQKGDRVIVVSGEDRGKEGVILKTDPPPQDVRLSKALIL